VGAFSCGLARDAVTGMLLANNVHFAGVDFLKPLSKYIDNPSVTGFMVEKAVLSSISLYGLNIVSGLEGKRNEVRRFRMGFPWGKMTENTKVKEFRARML